MLSFSETEPLFSSPPGHKATRRISAMKSGSDVTGVDFKNTLKPVFFFTWTEAISGETRQSILTLHLGHAVHYKQTALMRLIHQLYISYASNL